VIYVSRTHSAHFQRRLGVARRCPRCGDTPFAVVQARGQGEGHSPYMTDEAGAQRRAAERAYANLLRDAITARGLVPCPACGALDPRTRQRLRRALGVKLSLTLVIFAGIGAVGFFTGYPWFGYLFVGLGVAFVGGFCLEHLRSQRSLLARVTFEATPPGLRAVRPIFEVPEEGLAVYVDWDLPPAPEPPPAHAAEPSGAPWGRPAPAQPRPLESDGKTSAAQVVGILAACAAGAVLLGWGANAWLEGHQTIHVVNPCASVAEVTIGDASLTLGPGELRALHRPEGRHHVQVELQNGHRYETDIVVENSVTQRLRRSSAFIFNVLGAEAILWERVPYIDPRSRTVRPASQARVYMGADFHALHDVEDLFTEPPEEVELPNRTSVEFRVVVNRLQAAPVEIVEVALRENLGDMTQGVLFLQGHILGGNRDPALSARYVELCAEVHREEACQAVLQQAGLAQAH
jgi:hypothetical protein